MSHIDTWATIYSEQFCHAFGFERLGEKHLPEGSREIIFIEMRRRLL